MAWVGNFKSGIGPDSAVQATDAHFLEGTVTDRYNRITKSIVEVASAIGGCNSARLIAAAATAKIMAVETTLRRNLRTFSHTRQNAP